MFREYLSALRGFSRNARLYLFNTGLLGLTFGLQYLFFNLYVLSLGYDQVFVGLLASIPALVTALSAVPIGIFLPRLGYRRSLLLGVGLTLAAFVGWAFFPSREILILAAVLSGLGTSLATVSSSPMMVAVSNERTRTHLFGVQFGVNTFSGVFANLIGGYLPILFNAVTAHSLEGSSAYRGVFVVGMVLTLVALVPILRMRGLQGLRERPITPGQLKPHARVLAKLLAIEITTSLGAGMLMPFVNVYYRLRFGLSDPSIGAVFAASSLLTGCAALLAPVVATRLGKVRAIILTQMLSIPFLLVMGFVPLGGVSATGYLIRTALMNMSSPLFPAYAMGLVPTRIRPITASLMMLAWNAGWAISSWISGHIQVSAGFAPLFLITGALYVTSIVSTYFFFRHVAETTEAPTAEALVLDEAERT
jgi:MFS family permease